jgi:hypothetical protein
LARKIILPTDRLQPLDMVVAEQLVIDASREFFDNAPSGNMHYGYMKLAYEWYDASTKLYLYIVINMSYFFSKSSDFANF